MTSKDDEEAAFLAGWKACMKTCDPGMGGGVDKDAFNIWYVEKYGERDKRIADAEWSKRMDDANRAAGVDLL